MSFITSFDGTKIYYKKLNRKNSKGTVVFIHGGFFGNHTLLKKLYSHFKEYNLIIPDNRGQGNSDIPESIRSQKLEYYAQDILEILRKEKISKIFLVGVSFGGLIALKFCELYENKVKKLVLVSSTYTVKRYREHLILTKRFLPVFKMLVKVMDKLWLFPETRKADIDYSDLPQKFFHLRYGTRILLTNSVKTLLKSYELGFSIFRYDIPDKILHQIKLPVLLIFGEKDKIFPFELEIEMKTNLKNSKLMMIKGKGHNIYIHNHKDVSKLILDFLN